MKYVAALDQGTTSSRAVLFDETGALVAAHGIEFPQLYPEPGWVEHNPEDILNTQIAALREAVRAAAVDPRDILAVGITNQRETTLLWDRSSGKPLYNAIVWQCRRTAPLVERLKQDGLGSVIRDHTGLVADAYFSGTKLQWLLEHVDGARARADAGGLCFGTVDSWLAYHLTNERVHVTDATNASRTMLYNVFDQKWDPLLLRAMNVPEALLPRVVDSSGVIGTLRKDILGAEIPVAALAGDQHAALYGQGCFTSGMVKNTYGTGCFLLMNTGLRPVRSGSNLITTIAWRIDGVPRYALEGSVFMGGATIQWLRDELQMIKTAAESEKMAMAVPDNNGAFLVPAFTGLGAPYWDMYARGAIVGLTRGVNRNHIVRAALESIAFQTRDVLEAMIRDSGLKPGVLRVDGGASRNNFLMQFQANLLGIQVLRPMVTETTALGAAMLAARAVGLWDNHKLQSIWAPENRFTPTIDAETRERLCAGWAKAIERARNWADR